MPRGILGAPTQQAARAPINCERVVLNLSRGEKIPMRTRTAQILVWSALICLTATPARAQYTARPMADPATGETYHVEVSGDFWNPNPQIAITSEALGIAGTTIDFVNDLGITQTKFRQLKVVLRPGVKHKFRFEYTPISYEAEGAIKTNIIFNGIRYPVSLPVETKLEWKAYRFGYEWDFLYRDRGFVGLVIDAHYTDVQATLSNVLDTEFARARAPIPTIGGIGRVYVAPNISITGELTGLGSGGLFGEDYNAHYIDFDLYGTINFNNYVGAQVGYRSFNVFYHLKHDEGTLDLRGLYFGGAVRF